MHSFINPLNSALKQLKATPHSGELVDLVVSRLTFPEKREKV